MKSLLTSSWLCSPPLTRGPEASLHPAQEGASLLQWPQGFGRNTRCQGSRVNYSLHCTPFGAELPLWGGGMVMMLNQAPVNTAAVSYIAIWALRNVEVAEPKIHVNRICLFLLLLPCLMLGRHWEENKNQCQVKRLNLIKVLFRPNLF